MCHVRELFPKPISLPKNLIRPPPAPWVPGNQELLMLRCFPEMLEHRTSILWAELCGGLIFFFVCLSLYFNQLSAHNLDGLFFFFFPSGSLQLLPEIPVSSSWESCALFPQHLVPISITSPSSTSSWIRPFLHA